MKSASLYWGMAVGLVAAAAALAVVAAPGLTQSSLTVAPQVALGSSQQCESYSGVPDGWGRLATAGMVHVQGGEFELGSAQGYADERPQGKVQVKSFWIDRTEVTNAQFAAFVKATSYVTEPEREGAAVVFQAPATSASETPVNSWWHYTRGANWRHPEGPPSDLHGRDNQPVAQVTYADAKAYAKWLGRSLPSEAQWEYAAKAGGSAEKVERGPRDTSGKPSANFWQGVFPHLNTREDGYSERAPVGCYQANGYGLHDMIGNVWEWTADPYRGPHQPHGNGDPFAAGQAQGLPSGRGASMVIKGGSFLCSTDFCVRYRAAARHPQEANLATAHVGIRTVIVE